MLLIGVGVMWKDYAKRWNTIAVLKLQVVLG